LRTLPLVSIIIPVFNAEKYLSEAIESIISQSYNNWEIIIVDDGSNDNSLQIASGYESENIKIFSQKNRGASAARNYGLTKSKGTFIKFFDADDIINSKMLESQIKIGRNNPKKIVSSKWGRFYNDDIETFQLNPEECWQKMPPIEWICTGWRYAQSMTQPGIFLIPKEIIDNAGVWDERLNLVDDLEFFTRIILNSNGVIFSEDSVLFYRSGRGNLALSGQKHTLALQSYFLSLQLSTKYLLTYQNDRHTKLCSANMWQNFVYEYYPLELTLIEKAENEIKRLGGSDLKFRSGGITKILNLLMGWKTIKQIKYLLRS